MVESTEVEKQKSGHDPHPLGECRPWLFALTEVLLFLFLLFFFLLFLSVDIQNRFNRPFGNQQFFFLFSDLTVLSVVLLFLDCQLMKLLIQRLHRWELCNLQFVKGLLSFLNFHNRDRYSICGGRNGITSLLLSPLLLFIGILVFCLPMPDNMSRKDTENARRK